MDVYDVLWIVLIVIWLWSCKQFSYRVVKRDTSSEVIPKRFFDDQD